MIRRFHVSGHHKEPLRTNLWLVPAILVLAAIGLFAVTLLIDLAAFHGYFVLPSWVISGSADAARQILTTIAAAIITVVGVVFSIVIVALTLVSTQFGPRMLRTFIRDRGTQLTLGTFVATFVYAVLALVSIGGPGPRGTFVPHISITVTLALTVVDLAVLIYFINHVATQIQLPEVIAGISPTCPRRSRTTSATGRPGRAIPPWPPCWPACRSRAASCWPRTAATCSTSTGARCCASPSRPTRSSSCGTGPATSWPRAARWPRCGRPARRPGWPASSPGPTSPARTGRWPRTSRSASTSWWRSRSAPCPPRSTTRSPG